MTKNNASVELIASTAVAILTLSLTTSCGRSERSRESRATRAEPGSVILDSAVLSFTDLPKEKRVDVSKYCCYYYEGGWSATNMNRFDAKDAYFVELSLDTAALANLTFINSCGQITSTKRCTKEELQKKIDAVLADRPIFLYGKYKNRWKFFANGVEIPETTKFEGFEIVALDRSPGMDRDDLIVGPIPLRPTEMQIAMYYGGSPVREELSD